MKVNRGFPDGPVVKNLPCNSEDTGLIPDPGRSHMPWGNYELLIAKFRLKLKKVGKTTESAYKSGDLG